MAKRLTKRTINKIHELKAAGLNGVAISKAVGKSKPTVYKVLHSAPSSNGAGATTTVSESAPSAAPKKTGRPVGSKNKAKRGRPAGSLKRATNGTSAMHTASLADIERIVQAEVDRRLAVALKDAREALEAALV